MPSPFVNRTFLPTLVALFVVLTPGCRPPAPAPDPEVVAKVGDTPITRARLLAAWEKRQRGLPTILPATDPLADLVDEEAAYQQAQRSGFLDQPEVKAALRSFVVARFKETEYGKLPGQPEPAESDVRAYYVERQATLIRPPAVNLAILFLQVPRKATEEKRQEALQTITGWRQEVATAPDPARAFADLVLKHSGDTATRYRRGELGWMSESELGQRLPPSVVPRAMALTNAAISQPLEAPDGYYLLRVLGQRLAQQRPFEEVEPMLRHQLREQRRQAVERQFRERIRAGLVIQTNQAVLDALVLTNKPPEPPPSLPKAGGG